MSTKTDLVWPERLVLRDTKVFADEGQRIFSTATGYGYEKREYVRADIAEALSTSSDAQGCFECGTALIGPLCPKCNPASDARVGVKALEWRDLTIAGRDDSFDLIAFTAFDQFQITKDVSCEWPFVLRFGRGFIAGPSNYRTVDEAKAAAEEWYRARILSALAPSSSGEREDLHELVSAITDENRHDEVGAAPPSLADAVAALKEAAEVVLDWWHEWHDEEPEPEEKAAFEDIADALAKLEPQS